MRQRKRSVSRRQAIATGLAAVGALLLPGCKRSLAPTYGNILRMGDALTYVAQRTLLPGQALVKEYARSEITSFPATGTVNPGDPASPYYNKEYQALHNDDFKDWKLSVEGKVNKPRSYSMEDLRQFTARTQVTRHQCEEGWSAIAEWKGLPLAALLVDAGIKADARYVALHSFDEWVDCIDMTDALHPQTLLAYEMNGNKLPLQHGAPLRLRLETQIGYKSMKYLKKIVVTDKFVDTGDSGWAWYVGI